MSKNTSNRTSQSNLTQVDGHAIAPPEYDELPELTDEMLSRAVVRRGGRPRSANPPKLITLRLSPEVIESQRASGPGWQTRMAERLSPGPAVKEASTFEPKGRKGRAPGFSRRPQAGG